MNVKQKAIYKKTYYLEDFLKETLLWFDKYLGIVK